MAIKSGEMKMKAEGIEETPAAENGHQLCSSIMWQSLAKMWRKRKRRGSV